MRAVPNSVPLVVKNRLCGLVHHHPTDFTQCRDKCVFLIDNRTCRAVYRIRILSEWVPYKYLLLSLGVSSKPVSRRHVGDEENSNRRGDTDEYCGDQIKGCGMFRDCVMCCASRPVKRGVV
jgi:hypothetical protein